MSVLIEDREFPGIAEAARTGIQRGREMHSWWCSFPRLTMSDLPRCRPDSHMQYFAGTLPLDGVETSIQGCFQTSTFARTAAAGEPPVSLAEWVGKFFLRKCRWTAPDGGREGFLYRPALVKDPGPGEVRRVDQDFDLRLSEIGSRFEWAVVRLDVLDYMRAFPVVGHYKEWLEPLNREAGYMVLHPDFFTSPYAKPEGCVEEFCFGYSVAPWTVMPTIAAYGPGRFHSAFKQFRFHLLTDGTVSIEVLFLVAPRCRQVLNILGIDPYFDIVELLNKLTMGQTDIVERAREGVDHYAIGHHARVHDNLLTGMRRVWEETNWQAAAGLPAVR